MFKINAVAVKPGQNPYTKYYYNCKILYNFALVLHWARVFGLYFSARDHWLVSTSRSLIIKTHPTNLITTLVIVSKWVVTFTTKSVKQSHKLEAVMRKLFLLLDVVKPKRVILQIFLYIDKYKFKIKTIFSRKKCIHNGYRQNCKPF